MIIIIYQEYKEASCGKDWPGNAFANLNGLVASKTHLKSLTNFKQTYEPNLTPHWPD